MLYKGTKNDLEEFKMSVLDTELKKKKRDIRKEKKWSKKDIKISEWTRISLKWENNIKNSKDID